ncbi:MAG TPA: hypothetical protein VKU19_25225 [Bryobacteraceae bacterium]|nr:hypothetical protein [Bryobacteraceae bacterium]
MNTTLQTADPAVHSENIQRMLGDLIEHARKDLELVEEPRFQALLEATAEVLIGIQTAFVHYNEGKEKAWRR